MVGLAMKPVKTIAPWRAGHSLVYLVGRSSIVEYVILGEAWIEAGACPRDFQARLQARSAYLQPLSGPSVKQLGARQSLAIQVAVSHSSANNIVGWVNDQRQVVSILQPVIHEHKT